MNLLYKNCDDFPNEEMIAGQSRIEHYIQARDEDACLEWALQPFLYSPPPRVGGGGPGGKQPANHYLSVRLGDTWSKPININTIGMFFFCIVLFLFRLRLVCRVGRSHLPGGHRRREALPVRIHDQHRTWYAQSDRFVSFLLLLLLLFFVVVFVVVVVVVVVVLHSQPPGSGKNFRTIVVTITPRYIIYNNMDCELLYRQKESEETCRVMPATHTCVIDSLCVVLFSFSPEVVWGFVVFGVNSYHLCFFFAI
jgi:hypothetical protein